MHATDITEAAWTVRDQSHLLGVEDLVLQPSQNTGNSQKVLDKSMCINQFVEECVYWEDIPYQSSSSKPRMIRPHPFLLPSETMLRIANHDKSQLFGGNAELLQLPRFSETIKVLQKEGPIEVVLARVYTDGANYTGRSRKGTSKSVIVFFWNLCSGTKTFHNRKLITVLDSETLCHTCGCKGRCSVDRASVCSQTHNLVDHVQTNVIQHSWHEQRNAQTTSFPII